MIYTENVFSFIRNFKEVYPDFIEKHRRNKLPINYEIEDGAIRPSNIDGLEYYFDADYMEEAMKVIADWTNNVFGCGCTFTIGW